MYSYSTLTPRFSVLVFVAEQGDMPCNEETGQSGHCDVD